MHILFNYSYTVNKEGIFMNSLIGISIRGKTFYFQNIFSHKQVFKLKQLVYNYEQKYPELKEKDENYIINHFIMLANKKLKCNMILLNIDEILVIK